MSEPDDRFDRLLDAMVNKPPLDVSATDEPKDDDDKREPDED